jgi:hypothetical protein
LKGRRRRKIKENKKLVRKKMKENKRLMKKMKDVET